MSKKKDKEEVFACPVGRFFMDLHQIRPSKSPVVKHLQQSRIELLKAVRSLLDAGIEHLEKKAEGKGSKKATKIEVE
ncbi:MAG: hypothetical protein ABII06_04820 [Pseudomonadota bacterium]